MNRFDFSTSHLKDPKPAIVPRLTATLILREVIPHLGVYGAKTLVDQNFSDMGAAIQAIDFGKFLSEAIKHFNHAKTEE